MKISIKKTKESIKPQRSVQPTAARVTPPHLNVRHKLQIYAIFCSKYIHAFLNVKTLKFLTTSIIITSFFSNFKNCNTMIFKKMLKFFIRSVCHLMQNVMLIIFHLKFH